MQPSISPGPRSRRGFRPAAYLDLAGPGRRSCLALHRAGFAWPPRHRDAGALLPHHFTLACAHLTCGRAIGGVFLWHFPAGFPGWALPTARALWCPDFPRGIHLPRLHGQPVECTARESGARSAEPRPTAQRARSRSPRSRRRRASARRRRGTRRGHAPVRSSQTPRIESSSETSPGAARTAAAPSAPPRADRVTRAGRSACRDRAHVRPS